MEFLLSAPFGFISGDVDVNTNTCSGGLEGDPWNLEFNPLQLTGKDLMLGSIEGKREGSNRRWDG